MGLICDRVGRKVALVSTTLLIVIGATLGTAAHGVHGSAQGLFWFLTIARGITGVVCNFFHDAFSMINFVRALEVNIRLLLRVLAKLRTRRHREIAVQVNFYHLFEVCMTLRSEQYSSWSRTLFYRCVCPYYSQGDLNSLNQFGGPLAVSVFLIVLSAAGENHLETVWRVCFGIGILLPLTVFFFRLRMLSSKLYRKGAIKRMYESALTSPVFNVILGRVPYGLVFKRYWRELIGTCGAW